SRCHRRLGRAVLWQPGTDHAGVAAQMVAERQLNPQGINRTDLSRDAFIERVWRWKEQSGGTINAQMRRLGDSVDWSRDRFTMDAGLSRAVIEVFVRLHAEGLIYRGKRLVNWDPVLLTALSDLEVQAQEEDGQLWHVRYPFADGAGQLVVATTRPETILGDAAVAVHPEDPRYQELSGRQRLVVPRGDRSGAVLEPYLTDQWFVKIAALAAPAIAAVEQGRTRFVPETWARTYFEWMRNIRDWCVSRQLWWGHRTPAWYDGDGNIYV